MWPDVPAPRDWRLFFILAITLASVTASVLITAVFFWQLMPRALGPAVAVPLIVAPIASAYCAQLNHRLKCLNADLAFVSSHDLMTGLLQRGAFFRQAETLPEDQDVTLVVLDIDHFKQVNDRFGHITGDKVILAVAEAIRAAAKSGMAARFGGEEFLMLLPGGAAGAAEAIEDLRLRIAGLEFDEPGLAVTISAGLSHTKGGANIDHALRQADAALYAAKEQGRNRLCLDPRSKRRSSVLQLVRV